MADSKHHRDHSLTDSSVESTASTQNDRSGIFAELYRRAEGQRLTPAQRRIAQCLIENSSEIGFLSSMEVAKLADVSQPSVTRFASSLGFDGYMDMRKHLRACFTAPDSQSETVSNRYQAAVKAEIQNLEVLSNVLADEGIIDEFGKALADSRPLAVLGMRASAGLASQFAYFASKVHPDVRLLNIGGGTINEDILEQVKAAGGKTIIAFMMPLYPRETIRTLEFAREIGLKVALVTDDSLTDHTPWSDMVLKIPINTNLVFDSYCSPVLMVSVFLDTMCNNMKKESQHRLDKLDTSSRKRKVFMK